MCGALTLVLGSHMKLSLATPAKRATLWFASNLLWLSSVPAVWLYLERELRAGSYSTEADSIGIPLFGVAAWSVALLPFLNIAWWWLSRDYPGVVSIFTRRQSSNSVRAISISLVGFAALLGLFAVWELVAGAPEVALIVLSWVYLALAYRAVHYSARVAGAAQLGVQADAVNGAA
jgi:hypothetical protein